MEQRGIDSIKEWLSQALASGAHPRRILFVRFPRLNTVPKEKTAHNGKLLFKIGILDIQVRTAAAKGLTQRPGTVGGQYHKGNALGADRAHAKAEGRKVLRLLCQGVVSFSSFVSEFTSIPQASVTAGFPLGYVLSVASVAPIA